MKNHSRVFQVFCRPLDQAGSTCTVPREISATLTRIVSWIRDLVKVASSVVVSWWLWRRRYRIVSWNLAAYELMWNQRCLYLRYVYCRVSHKTGIASVLIQNKYISCWDSVYRHTSWCGANIAYYLRYVCPIKSCGLGSESPRAHLSTCVLFRYSMLNIRVRGIPNQFQSCLYGRLIQKPNSWLIQCVINIALSLSQPFA